MYVRSSLQNGNYAVYISEIESNHVPCFYGVIEIQVEVSENEKCCGNMSQHWTSVSKAFSSSPKLSRVFPQLDRNPENIFSIYFRKHLEKK